MRRDDEDRYRMRDDDERFDRGTGSHWEDRERGYQRDGESRGMGQSGYGAGRSADDSSMGTRNRNPGWGGAHSSERGSERGSEREYGRGGWEQGRRGMSQGYHDQDGDRPSFERGIHDVRPRGSHRGKGPKGFEYSDERIRERVCEALADDHDVDATHIDISVDKGEVTLTGTVEDRMQKRMAEDCVLQCSGVRDVHNQLRVQR